MARDLYSSPLFKLNLKYAQMLKHDDIFILSAKYGLLELDRVIEPYNKTLNKMSQNAVKKWAEQVLARLKEKDYDLKRDQFVFLAGMNYRKFLIPEMSNYVIPMQGLAIGKQLKLLKERTAA